MKSIKYLMFALITLIPLTINASETCDIDVVGYTDEYIQCVIDNASEGDVIVLPEGNYYIDDEIFISSISISDNLTIMGEGENTVITLTADDVYDFFEIDNLSITIKNLTLINVENDAYYTEGIDFLANDESDTLTVDNVKFYGFEIGVYATYGTVNITNSYFEVVPASSQSYYAAGIELYEVVDAVITNNEIVSEEVGIFIYYGSVATIKDNTITALYGVLVDNYYYISSIDAIEVSVLNIDTILEDNDLSKTTNEYIEYVNTNDTIYVISDTTNLEVFDSEFYYSKVYYSEFYVYNENGYTYLIDSESVVSAYDEDLYDDYSSVYIVSSDIEYEDVSIDEGDSLIISADSTLTITGDLSIYGTLVNNGTVIVNNDSNIGNSGTYTGDGDLSIDTSYIKIESSDYVSYSSFEKVILDTLISSNSYLNLILGSNDVNIELDVQELEEDNESYSDMLQIFESETDTNIVSMYNIDLYLNLDNIQAEITELSDVITITIDLPEYIEDLTDGYEREYYVLRYHGDEVEILEAELSEDGLSISFESDKYSVFALSYIDNVTEDTDVNSSDEIENPTTGDTIISSFAISSISLIILCGVSISFENVPKI